MASIWLWSAAPLMFVAGSRPAGQSPAKPVHSRTVSDPPVWGAPLVEGAALLDELLVELQAAVVRASTTAVPPRQNLRILFRPVEPYLMAFTHSISRHLTEVRDKK